CLGGERMPFESASPGQQATALLTVLLNQEGGPLLVDQPEDDLDNATINRIIDAVCSAKEKRQIIFTSHNANLVVNGDAELITVCNYCSFESRSAGRIEAAGAIEEPKICDAVKSVMEGGDRAFELRKAKYGF
ncbi:MAG: AAA family ATPase, partial [Candidatus Hydrogenedentes bacterium]|nr:AAA family ATPase [Candidatus Hydrogenedentota bacterium]